MSLRPAARRSIPAPERDGSPSNSSQTLRAPSNCFRTRTRPVCKHFRAPKIPSPMASSLQNRQAVKVTNSGLCLETGLVAATERRAGTPSPERGLERLSWKVCSSSQKLSLRASSAARSAMRCVGSGCARRVRDVILPEYGRKSDTRGRERAGLKKPTPAMCSEGVPDNRS